MRNVYMVLGGNAIRYAKVCMHSLLARVDEPIRLSLVTDSEDDKKGYLDLLSQLPTERHEVRVWSKADVDAVAEVKLKAQPRVREFRNGHPCWRKITDPVLLADDGEEVVILDPDLYFPNRFRFEAVPATGVYLMWQPPSCLFPEEAVERVFTMGRKVAHHVDIGVGMLRAPFDWPWLEAFCQEFQPDAYRKFMHVEAIVWSAYAMHVGGGYLNPKHYRCYRNPPWKRVALAAKVPPLRLLALEPFGSLKCYHAGGWPKNWLAEAEARNLFPRPADQTGDRPFLPYVEYTRNEERRKQAFRKILARVGILRA